MISYFPSSGGYRQLGKKGDVLCLGPSGLGASEQYSGNNVLSISNTWNQQKYVTFAYLPECLYVDGFKDGLIEKIIIPKCISIGYSAFQSCYYLKSIQAPACTTIEGVAFAYCSQLSYVNFPECTMISNAAFSKCSLNYLNFPKCTTIGISAFQNATLSSFNFPKLNKIYNAAFSSATFNFSSSIVNSTVSLISSSAFYKLQYSGTLNFTSTQISIYSYAFEQATIGGINIPNASSMLHGNVFTQCSNLSYVNLPNIQIIQSRAFASCYNLQNVTFTNCSLIYGTSSSGYSYSAPFYKCSALSTISLPNIQKLSGIYIFNECINLQSVYLMGSSVCSILTTSAFRNTPITDSTYLGYFGSIYVPQSLLATYKAANVWSRISDRIVGI